MSELVLADGSRHAVFGSGGGDALAAEIGAPLVARIPLEPAVSEGGDTGRPIVSSAPDSPAALEFRRLADRIVTDLLPPIEMSGCTARIFDLIAQAEAADA
jgi:ATP-binding protein involved in chromosome partitioning